VTWCIGFQMHGWCNITWFFGSDVSLFAASRQWCWWPGKPGAVSWNSHNVSAAHAMKEGKFALGPYSLEVLVGPIYDTSQEHMITDEYQVPGTKDQVLVPFASRAVPSTGMMMYVITLEIIIDLRFRLHLAYVINEAHMLAVDSVQTPQNMHVNPNVKNIQTTWIQIFRNILSGFYF